MSYPCRPAARRGFTLVEILVTIAIIILLLSMLLPALGMARDQGRIAKCCSNLRQVSLFHSMYVTQEEWPTWHLGNDYNGQSFDEPTQFIYGGFQAPLQYDPYVSVDAYVVPTNQRPLNAVIIKPSAQDRQPIDIYQCPSDSKFMGLKQPCPTCIPPDIPEPTWQYTGLSYPINWWWGEYFVTNQVAGSANAYDLDTSSQPGMPTLGRQMLRRKVGGPSGRFIMFYESLMQRLSYFARPDGQSDFPLARGWHRGFSKYTVAFLDGSVAHRFIDTRYTVDPEGGAWTTWPEPRTTDPDMWYP